VDAEHPIAKNVAAEHPEHPAEVQMKPVVKTPAPVVTSDIQAQIEAHVEREAAANEGFFPLSYEGRELQLKLVRVHTEYLSSLGGDRHFACVDLVDTEGDVYDVDFFMQGDAGGMSVTETTAHKLNGKPFYSWQQEADKTWKRVPTEGAPNFLLGVIEDRDAFEFTYELTLPSIENTGRMWLPVARSDDFQTITSMTVEAPGKQTMLDELEYGNKVLFLELGPEDSGKTITMRYQVTRLEKAAYDAKETDFSLYLQALNQVPIDQQFKTIADEVLKGKKGDLVRARALYDHVIEKMAYKKVGEGWGKGSAVYACNLKTGNCTDFHSYFLALARAAGIPARFAIGAPIPSERNEGRIDGYHCWAEFYAEGKWWPVDISEGDKYTSLATYYFGHHPANRIELSQGRDLVVEPAPMSGPINFLAYPVFELDGETVKLKPIFSFVRAE